MALAYGLAGLKPRLLAKPKHNIMGNITKIWGVCTSYTRVKDLWHITLRDENGEYIVVVSDMQVNCDIECESHYFVLGETIGSIVLGTCVEEWGRICDHCGKWHTEGYFVGEYEYACSKECAIALYNGNEDAFYADLAMLDDPETEDDAVTYWTEWEN